MTSKRNPPSSGQESGGIDYRSHTSGAASGAPRVEETRATREQRLPDDLPGESDISRALFHGRDDATAVELLAEGRVVYLMPWAATDGIAGYEQDPSTFEARPVEYTGAEARRLLEERRPRTVPLQRTPAWLLDEFDGDGVNVSWHARVRWNERVEQLAAPAPRVREAYRSGVSVGVDYGHGRYHAPTGAVLAAVYRDDHPLVTTVFPPSALESVGSDHLTECERCGELYDPGNTTACNWCSEGRRSDTTTPDY